MHLNDAVEGLDDAIGVSADTGEVSVSPHLDVPLPCRLVVDEKCGRRLRTQSKKRRLHRQRQGGGLRVRNVKERGQWGRWGRCMWGHPTAA